MDVNSILHTFTCPAALPPEQFLSVIAYVERTMPDADLNHELVQPGRPKRLVDRAGVIRAASLVPDASSSFFLYNSVEEKIFSFTASFLVHWRTESYWYVCFERPAAALSNSEMAAFMLGLGDLLKAYDGQATTYRSGAANSQLNRGMDSDFIPPHGLPPLYPPETYVSMNVPFCIEWANYWSRETADTMGFAKSAHVGLFDRWQRGPTGSLAFQLTPEPIDLDRPEDIDALRVVYSTFPGVGGRDPKFRIADEAPSQEGA